MGLARQDLSEVHYSTLQGLLTLLVPLQYCIFFRQFGKWLTTSCKMAMKTYKYTRGQLPALWIVICFLEGEVYNHFYLGALTLTPLSLTVNPKNLSEVTSTAHFSGFSFSWLLHSLLNTILILSDLSSYKTWPPNHLRIILPYFQEFPWRWLL